MLQGEHSAILLTFIMLPLVIKISVLSIFERPFYTGLCAYGIRIKISYAIPDVLISYKQVGIHTLLQ